MSSGIPPGGFSRPGPPVQGYGPPAPPGGPYGAPTREPGADADLFAAIRARSTRKFPLKAQATSVKITTRPCILVGWHLRDASGAAGSVGGQIDVDASSANAAAANNVSLAGAAGATTFITGFEITGAGATGASEITVTVTGILGGTKTYKLAIPAGAGAQVTPLLVEFARPIPASALNTAIVVNVPSFGAGNTDAAVTAHGFQQTGAAVSGPAFVADLFDGGDATGELVAAMTGLGDGLDTSDIGVEGPACRVGLFLNVVAGSVQGAVWFKE